MQLLRFFFPSAFFSFLFILFAFNTFSAPAFATGQWTYTGNVVNPVTGNGDQAVLLNDGRVLLVSAFFSSSSMVSQLYDPTTGQWTAINNVIVGRYNPFLIKLQDGRVLMIGSDQSGVGATEIYDLTTDQWSQTGSLNYPRNGHRAVLLPDGRVFVAGGLDGNNQSVLQSEIYGPATGQWTVDAATTNGYSRAGLTVLSNGKILITGESGNYGNIPTTELYSLTTLPTPTVTPTPLPYPTHKEQCKHGGWINFTNPTFSNQGQCIHYVNSH